VEVVMSAVIKEKHIETIFDYDVTDDELEELLGGIESVNDYLSVTSQDTAYADLFFLHQIRDNKARAQFFLNQITDDNYRRAISFPSCVAH
jgi:hypothetical protein